MDCPPNVHTCIDVEYFNTVTHSQTVDLPVCLGGWAPIFTEGDQVAGGSYGLVFLVHAEGDGIAASVMQGGQVVAVVRAPATRAWECVPGRPDQIS